MNTPAAALVWELWARNRWRFATILAILLGFVLIYPLLCAYGGLNLESRDALDEVVCPFGAPGYFIPSWFGLLRISALLLLVLGPPAAMNLTLLAAIWMFTFGEFNPKSKNPLSFPSRLFTLPISTNFLWFFLMFTGMAALGALYLAWVHLVRLPRIGLFTVFQDGYAWLTLLALAQAILWSLNNWPKIRALLVASAVLAFFMLPALAADHPVSFHLYRPHVLILLLLISGFVAYLGLARIRHGRWQTYAWNFKWPGFAAATAARERPKTFYAANRAQFWFEWRASAAGLVFGVAGVTAIFLLFTALLVVCFGRLTEDTVVSLGLCLVGLPPFVFQLYGLTGGRGVPVFNLIRPVTSGEIVMVKLKALTLSAVFSWGAVLAALCAFPIFGDLSALPQHTSVLSTYLPPLRSLLPIILPGVIFVTWGLAAGNLCFGMAGPAWPAKIPAIAFWVAMVGGTALLWLGQEPEARQFLLRSVPGVLGFLVVAKLFLACWAFRVALCRKLLARAAMMKYLIVWTTFAAIFIVPTILVLRHELGCEQVSTTALFSLSCGILLMMPLARIAFAPIALSLGRHRTS